MPVRTRKTHARAPIWTAPGARPMLQRKLLPRTQPLAVVIVAILPRLALAVKMVIVAYFAITLDTIEEALLRGGLHAWEIRVQALVVGV